MITFPYQADRVHATLTILVMKDGSVQLGGLVEPIEQGRLMLGLGTERMEQYHAEKNKEKVKLYDPDGRPMFLSETPRRDA